MLPEGILFFVNHNKQTGVLSYFCKYGGRRQQVFERNSINCKWVASSLGIMTAYAINERKRIFRTMIDLGEIKFSRNLVYIINIIVGYQHHYKEHPLSFKGGFWVVALLQVISLILFLLVYCIEDKPKS